MSANAMEYKLNQPKQAAPPTPYKNNAQGREEYYGRIPPVLQAPVSSKGTVNSASTSSRPSARSNGGGGRGYGGGTAPRISSNPYGSVSTVQPMAVAPPPAPTMPSVDEWLSGDSTYQSQLAALAKALTDYQAQMGQQKTQYGVDYGAKVNELGLARGNALKDLENDFASRGLRQSGLYFDNQTEMNGQYDRRQSDLDRAKTDYEANLATAFSNFQTEQNLTSQRAREDALAKRAAQFGMA